MDTINTKRSLEWHLEHKRMGFIDPIADLFELLDGLEEDSEISEMIEELEEADDGSD